MCITFVLGMDISIDASNLELATIAGTHTDAVLTLASARPASLRIQEHVLSPGLVDCSCSLLLRQ